MPRRLMPAVLTTIVALYLALAGRPLPAAETAGAARLGFSEVWAYLLAGEERYLDASFPITDLGYFGAGINTYGKLVGVPDRAKVKAFKGRVHLVVAEVGNAALTHFCLDPAYPVRDALVADIVAGAAAFDGVQLDFEAIGANDYDNYYEFVRVLGRALGKKTLSVTLPARMSERGDEFGYARFGLVADRVIVMAYDEHWSSSVPGPVASIDWCRKVAVYALSKVDPSKLVMGAPFYGRAWADKNPSRAYRYSGISSLLEEKGIGQVQRQDDIPYVEYMETVSVKVYFDDSASTLSRLGMYRAASVGKVAFWRLGQEDPAVWAGICVTAPDSMPASPAVSTPVPPAGSAGSPQAGTEQGVSGGTGPDGDPSSLAGANDVDNSPTGAMLVETEFHLKERT